LGIAAQLIGTKRRSRRDDQAWIRRAVTSLPVPVSPVSSTAIDVCATRAAWRTMAVDAALWWTIWSAAGSGGSGVSSSSSRARMVSTASLERSDTTS
jgi:hypothetical protein